MVILNRVAAFSLRQLVEVRKGGITIVLQKLSNLMFLLLAVPLVILIRLLSIFVIIRFGSFNSSRIGHFSSNTEIYLCKRDRGIGLVCGKTVYDIFYHEKPVCNYQLKKMWDRVLPVFPFTRLAHSMLRFNHYLPGGNKYDIPKYNFGADKSNSFLGTQPHLSFSKKEEKFGREQLSKLGIPNEAPFICFHARDAVYLDSLFPSANWHYHDYRDCSIKNYIPAAEGLTKKGYFMVRMGAKVKEPLVTTNPMIIDYAVKYRTDFLDIYLSAKCFAFIGCGAGIDSVAEIFRRPVAFVNASPFALLFDWNPMIHLVIPKMIWMKEENRYMKFGEILKTGAGNFIFTEQYEKAGLELIESTPEEITDLAMEMEKRLKGTWDETEEDSQLQSRFRSILELNGVKSNAVTRIGADFLRKNKELL